MFFLNFTLDIFLLWIRQRGEPSTTARLKEGLYPLKSLEKHVFSTTKPSQSRWHSRLGHPSLQIMHQVLSQNKLPVPSESSNQMVMHVKWGRLINYLTPSRLVCLLSHWSSSALMFGGPLLSPWDVKSIT
jgi:hypothetical protein